MSPCVELGAYTGSVLSLTKPSAEEGNGGFWLMPMGSLGVPPPYVAD